MWSDPFEKMHDLIFFRGTCFLFFSHCSPSIVIKKSLPDYIVSLSNFSVSSVLPTYWLAKDARRKNATPFPTCSGNFDPYFHWIIPIKYTYALLFWFNTELNYLILNHFIWNCNDHGPWLLTPSLVIYTSPPPWWSIYLTPPWWSIPHPFPGDIYTSPLPGDIYLTPSLVIYIPHLLPGDLYTSPPPWWYIYTSPPP